MKIDWNDIYDYTDRIETMRTLLGESDLNSVITFLILGNIEKNATLPDILKSYNLNSYKLTWNKEKIEKWRGLIIKAMNEFDDYGILDMQKSEIVKVSQNMKYYTIYGHKILPIVYYDFYDKIRNKEEYVISIIYGIYRKLELLIKYFEIREIG